MYRAQSGDYQLDNNNAADLFGVIWYLQHEVVITNPPKFGITRIMRFKMTTRAPEALYQKGMQFGARYAYDSRECTGPGICEQEYKKYGYFVGCNNLGEWPYPKFDVHYSSGIWYSLPSAGDCAGIPTGANDCTWSHEPAGYITLADLMKASPALKDNGPDDGSLDANWGKVAAAANLFYLLDNPPPAPAPVGMESFTPPVDDSPQADAGGDGVEPDALPGLEPDAAPGLEPNVLDKPPGLAAPLGVGEAPVWDSNARIYLSKMAAPTCDFDWGKFYS